MERVADDRRLHFAAVDVEAESGGFRGAIVGRRHATPLIDGQSVDHFDGGGAVGPEVDHAPAELALGHQQFDARRVAVARVKASRVQDRRAGVLFAETQEGREREGIQAAQLLEFR